MVEMFVGELHNQRKVCRWFGACVPSYGCYTDTAVKEKQYVGAVHSSEGCVLCLEHFVLLRDLPARIDSNNLVYCIQSMQYAG